MISDSQIKYGSRVFLHGKSRLYKEYQECTGALKKSIFYLTALKSLQIAKIIELECFYFLNNLYFCTPIVSEIYIVEN
jgi:hypothetical protein